jgi:hypothetical protein
MTEEQWLSCCDVMPMLESLRASERKLRLFAVACCRRMCDRLSGDQRRQATVAAEVAERVADGLVAEEEMLRVPYDGIPGLGWATASDIRVGAPFAAQEAAGFVSRYAFDRAAERFADVLATAEELAGARAAAARAVAAERQAQAALLRDILGNPFVPPPQINPTWLSWNGGTIKKLASTLYAEGAFTPERLGVVADALFDAGCCDERILGHLRSPGPHAKGCFVLDALLGKS